MARQTRQQRRAERRQLADGGAGAPPRPPQTRNGGAAGGAAPAAQPRSRGSGFGGFVSESIAELKKVEWPRQQQLIQGTVVVLIACVIVGLYLWVSDLAFHRLVRDVFLR